MRCDVCVSFVLFVLFVFVLVLCALALPGSSAMRYEGGGEVAGPGAADVSLREPREQVRLRQPDGAGLAAGRAGGAGQLGGSGLCFIVLTVFGYAERKHRRTTRWL